MSMETTQITAKTEEYEALLERFERLQKARKFDTRITALGPGDVPERTLQACLDLTGADSGDIRLREEEKLIKGASVGKFPAVMAQAIPLSAGHIPCVSVVRLGEPHIANCARKDKYIKEWKHKVEEVDCQVIESIGSYVSYPLQFEEQIIGVLSLHSAKEGFFTPEICDLVEDILPTAAIAIENARLHEDLRRRVRELAGLGDVGIAITAARNLEEMLRLIVESAIKIVGADMAVIFPYEQELGRFQLELVASHGVPSGITFKTAYPRPHGTHAKVMQEGVVIVRDTKDVEQYPFISHADDSFVIRAGVRSFVGARLRVAGEDAGVLYVDFLYPRSFSSSEIDTIVRLANQAAIAVKDVRAFEDTQRHIHELYVLNQIAQDISSSAILETDELLETVYNQVAKLMDVTNFYIAFYDENMVTFRFVVEGGQRQELGRRGWRKAGNGLTEYIIRTSKPCLIAREVEKWLDSHGVDSIGKPAKSWIGAPMICRDRVLGVIGVQSYEKENAYDEAHLDVLATIASQTASAIENARLVEDLVLAREELRDMMEETLEDTGDRFAGQVFYGRIAHDVKNVLAATSAHLQELSGSPAMKRLPKTQQRRLGDLIKRVGQSCNTIETFLEITKEPERRMDYYDVNRMTKQAARLLRGRMELNEIEVDYDGLTDNLPEVYVNRVQVIMVLFNLISNAVDAMSQVDRQRKLRLQTRMSKDSGWVELMIRDNGCGMSREDQLRVFEPYFSAKMGKGVGLGLFGSQRLIKRHGGEISFQSRYQKGTTFTVRLPASKH
jgi:signal transduction histidine kinase